MPNYRLVNGYGYPTDLFTATCDDEARVWGMTRAQDHPRPEPRLGARRDFQVHREDAGSWRLLVAFAPV